MQFFVVALLEGGGPSGRFFLTPLENVKQDRNRLRPFKDLRQGRLVREAGLVIDHPYRDG